MQEGPVTNKSGEQEINIEEEFELDFEGDEGAGNFVSSDPAADGADSNSSDGEKGARPLGEDPPHSVEAGDGVWPLGAEAAGADVNAHRSGGTALEISVDGAEEEEGDVMPPVKEEPGLDEQGEEEGEESSEESEDEEEDEEPAAEKGEEDDAEDQESLASEHDDDELAANNGDDDEEDAKMGKRKKEDSDEEEDDKAKTKKQRKTLGLDARKIRKIKDVSGEAKVLQDREEERARWEEELRKRGTPSAMGKEIINPFAEPSDQIKIHPILAARLKPHQVEGVRFLWQRAMDGRAHGNNARGGLGSLHALEDGDKGAGCVLAHNMGLGKTFQVITFLHTIAVNIPVSNIELRRMLVLGPVNTLQNWKAELDRWIPERGVLPGNRHMSVFILDEAGRTSKLRCDCLAKWFKEGGVMCMGYEMYRNLTQGTRVQDKKVKSDLHRYLRDPGPGILVADEGHLLRNHNSNVSKAVAAVKTKRRIVLTGSPLQNNLTEYHCMIDFINHGFLGSLNEFRNQYEIPIMNGEAKDARPEDVKRMKYRNHVLTKKLEPMIQRKDFTPLVQSLPPKYEFTLKIRLSDIQKKLYRYAINNRDECGMFSVLKAFHTLLKIWNHPAVLCLTAKPDDSQKTGGLDTAAGRGGGDVPSLEEEDDSDCQVMGEDHPFGKGSHA
eukprot:CAMPEP_0179429774 /NCGR_PEP_ID=MMETSP0799-20121207/15062_1 /TAXON_ID=46947 /ORGANISM="Geminigera cryophila, Strain CCMP2564" /LENGTH=666 /DNA_ID=CAMNT_0021205837 /DNA_START=164 /DNA_END=2160 /DNA_ORIENTATION=-